jgi:hypothetical protein
LSGFVFLFCCVAMFGGPMWEASSSMDSMSDHCKKAMAAKSAKESDNGFELRGAERFDCCGFLPAVFDKNRKIDRIDKVETVSSQRISVRFDIKQAAGRPSTIVKRRPYIPDRRYTFLKYQVFRI